MASEDAFEGVRVKTSSCSPLSLSLTFFLKNDMLFDFLICVTGLHITEIIVEAQSEKLVQTLK